MKNVSIVLAGIGGYGLNYLRVLLEHGREHSASLVACVDPFAEQSEFFPRLRQLNIPIFPSLSAFYKTGHADLVVLSSPIQCHAPDSCLAMTHGSHVLCEKPVAGTLADARRMATTARNTGRFLAIGYQWSFSSAIQNLKMDILAGVYGKPRRLKTVVLWPRNRSYYQRNSWAGAIRTQDGTVVLDSPVNNATAHYLHNMLFLLGGEPGSAALPTTVEAELYRANPIANYDAAALRVHTAGGAELLMLTAHTSPVSIGPLFEYEFENGVVRFPDPRGGIRGQRTDGTLTNYGDPEAEGNMIKLWQCVEAAQSGGRPACDIEAATAHLLCVLGAQQSQPVISAVPSSFVVQEEREDNDILTWIRGLPELFLHAFAAGRLPNELGLAEWTIPPARTIQFDEIADLS